MTFLERSRLAFASTLLLALLGAVAAFVGTQTARAGSEACAPYCVVLIEVDGLEAKDVTPQTTPFLWALAHPDSAQTSTATSPTTATEFDPAAADSIALSGRNGWIWQAPRGAMTTSTAASTAALLTGGYPQQD